MQPYGVTIPANYAKELGKKWRLDIVLHGRNDKLTEVQFLKGFMGEKAAPAGQDYIKIDIFGRGNNAYRWAGETDVFEALDHFAGERTDDGPRARILDSNKIVLRGFSMGGAGTWHLGLHFPDRWCVIGPGAGFTTTHGYVAKLPNPLPYPRNNVCASTTPSITPRTPLTCRSSPIPAPTTHRKRRPTTSKRNLKSSACP